MNILCLVAVKDVWLDRSWISNSERKDWGKDIEDIIYSQALWLNGTGLSFFSLFNPDVSILQSACVEVPVYIHFSGHVLFATACFKLCFTPLEVQPVNVSSAPTCQEFGFYWTYIGINACTNSRILFLQFPLALLEVQKWQISSAKKHNRCSESTVLSNWQHNKMPALGPQITSLCSLLTLYMGRFNETHIFCWEKFLWKRWAIGDLQQWREVFVSESAEALTKHYLQS